MVCDSFPVPVRPVWDFWKLSANYKPRMAGGGLMTSCLLCMESGTVHCCLGMALSEHLPECCVICAPLPPPQPQPLIALHPEPDPNNPEKKRLTCLFLPQQGPHSSSLGEGVRCLMWPQPLSSTVTWQCNAHGAALHIGQNNRMWLHLGLLIFVYSVASQVPHVLSYTEPDTCEHVSRFLSHWSVIHELCMWSLYMCF